MHAVHPIRVRNPAERLADTAEAQTGVLDELFLSDTIEEASSFLLWRRSFFNLYSRRHFLSRIPLRMLCSQALQDQKVLNELLQKKLYIYILNTYIGCEEMQGMTGKENRF